MDPAELLAKLKSYEGQTIRTNVGRHPVNVPMIDHWTDAIGDLNPVHRDPEFAAKSVHGGLVAPPAMLQVWTMRGLAPDDEEPDAPEDETLMEVLEGAGFIGVVATNYDQEYMRYLRPGDEITSVGVIEKVTDEKKTALGPGHFVQELWTFTDQYGEVIGTMRWSMLRFRPPES